MLHPGSPLLICRRAEHVRLAIHVFPLNHNHILDRISRYFVEHCCLLEMVLVVRETDIEFTGRDWLGMSVYGNGQLICTTYCV